MMALQLDRAGQGHVRSGGRGATPVVGRRGRCRRVLHGRRPGPGAGHPAARRASRPVCRSTGSSRGPKPSPTTRSCQAAVLAPRRRNDEYFTPEAAARPRSSSCEAWARTPSSTSTTAPITPSSTTPGPRSTTPPRRARRGSARSTSSTPTSGEPRRRPGARGAVGRYLELGPRPRPPHRRPRRRLLRPPAWPSARRARRRSSSRRTAGRATAGPCWPRSTPARPSTTATVPRPCRRRRGQPRAGGGCGPRPSGLLTTARRLAGEPIGYAEEVEACYGVRPAPVPEDDFAARPPAPWRRPSPGRAAAGAAHRLARVARRGRRRACRRCHRRRWPRTCASAPQRLFGLPDGEHVEFELVTDKPWSGFNTYLGDLHSTVAVNTDLPVLSTSLAHLVAHEAYPGHHTEHCRKEVGLVRRRRWLEETIFLVGTPAVPDGRRPGRSRARGGPRAAGPKPSWPHTSARSASATTPRSIAAVAEASEALGAVRANAAWRLHAEGADPDAVIDEVARWGLLPRAGRPRRWSSSCTRRGVPTSRATSRACGCAGASWAATPPASPSC